MTEEYGEARSPEEFESEDAAPTAVQTGNPAVDAVIGSLEQLAGLEVDDHVAVFESAHEQLRRTLAGAGDDRA